MGIAIYITSMWGPHALKEEYYQEYSMKHIYVIYIRCSSYWSWKSTKWTFLNNLGFSLYAVPPVCYVVTTSNNRKKSEMGVSANLVCVTNFIQLVSPQLVDWFSQTKLHWKALNKGYLHIYGMYKSDNKWLRYQAINSCKSFVC